MTVKKEKFIFLAVVAIVLVVLVIWIACQMQAWSVKNQCPCSNPEGSVNAMAPPNRLYNTMKLYMPRCSFPGFSQGAIRHIYIGMLQSWNGKSPQE